MGVVSIAVPFNDRWYFSEAVRGVQAQLAAAGHSWRLHVLPPSETATVTAANAIEEDFQNDDSLGAVVAGFKYRPDQSVRAAGWRRPIVVIGGSVLGFPTVMIDDIGAAAMATEHLVRLGHRSIVHFAGLLENQMDFSVNGRRARGYRLAMTGLDEVVVQNDFVPEQVYETASALLASRDRPTAVFAVSDEIAFPILAAARDLGLHVGQDLAVVSIDDHPQAAEEDLTTVRQDPAAMGGMAAELLLNGLNQGPNPKQSRLAPIKLIQRGSSGPARLRM